MESLPQFVVFVVHFDEADVFDVAHNEPGTGIYLLNAEMSFEYVPVFFSQVVGNAPVFNNFKLEAFDVFCFLGQYFINKPLFQKAFRYHRIGISSECKGGVEAGKGQKNPSLRDGFIL